ncbi:MAG: hypothetical protein RRY12_01370 [Cloacibacillus sp.]
MGEVIIWVKDNGRGRIAGHSKADYSPLPLGAIPITRVPECDTELMLEWIRKQIALGWSAKRMRAQCR